MANDEGQPEASTTFRNCHEGSATHNDGGDREGTNTPRQNSSLDTWDEMSTVLPTPPSPAASTRSMPFRLLDLPQELQDKVYQQLYAQQYDLNVSLKNSPRRDRQLFQRKIVLSVPPHNLESACRKTRLDAGHIRKEAFSGCLHPSYTGALGLRVLHMLNQDQFAWLRVRVSKIVISVWTLPNLRGNFTPETWDTTSAVFPNLKTIVLASKYRRMKFSQTKMINPEWEMVQSPGYDAQFSTAKRMTIPPLQSVLSKHMS